MLGVKTKSRVAGHAIGKEGASVSRDSGPRLRRLGGKGSEDCAGFGYITLELQEESRRTLFRAVGREYGAQVHAFIEAL